MPNKHEHSIGAGLAAITAVACHELKETGEISWKTLAAGLAAATLGSLPDKLEPAIGNPNHRQFFHSWAMFLTVAYGTYKTYQWEPETELEIWLRRFFLVAEIAYMTHLVMDARTSKSLPLLGKI